MYCFVLIMSFSELKKASSATFDACDFQKANAFTYDLIRVKHGPIITNGENAV